MPRLLLNASAAAIESKSPVDKPIGVMMKYPRTHPPNHISASTGPMIAPIPSAIGETHIERAGKREEPPKIPSTAGSFPSPSLMNVKTAERPRDVKSTGAPFPSFPAMSVLYAASPIGYGRFSFSMNVLLNMIVNNVPRTAPVTEMATIDIAGRAASGSVIHSPGRVNARPPATIAPALMRVCVQFISSSVEPFALPSIAIERTVTKTVGQGSAPILRATYMLDAVIMISPMIPTVSPLVVRGDFFASIVRILYISERCKSTRLMLYICPFTD